MMRTAALRGNSSAMSDAGQGSFRFLKLKSGNLPSRTLPLSSRSFTSLASFPRLSCCAATNLAFGGSLRTSGTVGGFQGLRNMYGVHAFPLSFNRFLPFASALENRSYASHPGTPETMYATTILCVRKGGKVVVIGDGQVTQGSYVVKDNAKKVRTLQNGKILTGFAGAAVDALALFDRLESKLDQYPELMRACVELAKEWRSDKSLRRTLNAVMVVADKDLSLTISGNGDILEPMNGVIGIGSGGIYAQCAAMALIDIESLDAEEVARRSMKIASDTCIYTNHNYVVQVLDGNSDKKPVEEKKDGQASNQEKASQT